MMGPVFGDAENFKLLTMYRTGQYGITLVFIDSLLSLQFTEILVGYRVNFVTGLMFVVTGIHS